MRNVISLICAVAMLAASGAAFADWRCWTEPDGFEDCVYDKNYNAYGAIRHRILGGVLNDYYADRDNKELDKIFGYAEAAKLRSDAANAGMSVSEYLASKTVNTK